MVGIFSWMLTVALLQKQSLQFNSVAQDVKSSVRWRYTPRRAHFFFGILPRMPTMTLSGILFWMPCKAVVRPDMCTGVAWQKVSAREFRRAGRKKQRPVALYT